MNTYDKRAGFKAIGTGIGAAVGGPIGAGIGNAVGTLAGSLFKPKTIQTKEVNFDTNVDPSLAFREDEFGKGYSIGYRMDQEKPTGFSNVLSTVADLAPQAMSAAGITKGLDFKGMFGSKDSFVDPLNKPLDLSTDIDKSLKSLFQEGKSGSSFGGAKIEGLGNTGVTKTVVDPIFGDSMKPLDFGTSIDNLLTKKIGENSLSKPKDNLENSYNDWFGEQNSYQDHTQLGNPISMMPKLSSTQNPMVPKNLYRLGSPLDQIKDNVSGIKNVNYNQEIEDYKKKNPNAKYYME